MTISMIFTTSTTVLSNCKQSSLSPISSNIERREENFKQCPSRQNNGYKSLHYRYTCIYSRSAWISIGLKFTNNRNRLGFTVLNGQIFGCIKMIVENYSIFYTMHKFAPATSFSINQNDHGRYHTFCIGMFSAAVSLIISILSCTNESPGR